MTIRAKLLVDIVQLQSCIMTVIRQKTGSLFMCQAIQICWVCFLLYRWRVAAQAQWSPLPWCGVASTSRPNTTLRVSCPPWSEEPRLVFWKDRFSFWSSLHLSVPLWIVVLSNVFVFIGGHQPIAVTPQQIASLRQQQQHHSGSGPPPLLLAPRASVPNVQVQGQRIIQQGLIRVANVANSNVMVNIPQVRTQYTVTVHLTFLFYCISLLHVKMVSLY